MHVGERELVLVLRLVGLRVLIAEELLTPAPLRPLHILLGGHQDGGVQVAVAYLRTDEIEVQRVVVLHLLTDVVGHLQVERRRVEVGHLHRRGLGNAPAALALLLLLTVLVILLLTALVALGHGSDGCYAQEHDEENLQEPFHTYRGM